MTVSRLLHEIDSQELTEWMSFELLKGEEYREKVESKMKTSEQRSSELKTLLGGSNGNN